MLYRGLEETVDTTDGELESGFGRSRLGSLFGGRGLTALASLTTFASFSRLIVVTTVGVVVIVVVWFD